MPLTTQQTSAVLSTVQQLQQVLFQVQSCAADTQGLLGTAWTTTQTIGQTQVQYTLTADQQSAIVAEYTSLKAQLATLYSQLP